jgi:hypothetical protein
MTQNYHKAAKAKIVLTLPALCNTEVGEIYYDATNGKIAIRTVGGWVQFTQD